MPNEVVGFKINGSTYNYDHDHLANLPAIDATPTAGSTNAVQSGGVKTALDGLQAEIPTVDSTPTQGSNNAVSSGGVWSEIAQIVPGLSEDAKTALLACFEHVAWIDEHGEDYYNALERALYPDSYWDYEWYASSGVLPEGMIAYRYNFTREPGVLYVENPYLDFNYIGDCRLMIECKWYCYDEDLTTTEFIEESHYGNNPQLFALNNTIGGLNIGARVIGHAGGQSDTGDDLRFLAGQEQTYYGYKDNVYHVYDLVANGSEYSISLPNDSFSVSGSGLSSQYNHHTGIYSVYPPMTTTNRSITALFIKSIKFKKF